MGADIGDLMQFSDTQLIYTEMGFFEKKMKMEFSFFVIQSFDNTTNQQVSV